MQLHFNLLIRQLLLVLLASAAVSGFASEPTIISVWPATPPNETESLPPEDDTPQPNDRMVAGRNVRRIHNVSVPQLAVYRPKTELNTGAAVIICPGGGHRILAYDLEGIEVAQWLNSFGITGIVLKYRVPFRDETNKSLAAVQDAQRAMSLIRSRSAEFGIDPNKLGIMGFSAGGEVAARTTLLHAKLHYDAVDAVDATSCKPDFGILIYPAYLVDKDKTSLLPELQPTKETPPIFMVHAWDDGVTPLSSILLAAELKRAAVPCELHLFSKGGHGYGLRHVDGVPVTDWTTNCQAWLSNLLK